MLEWVGRSFAAPQFNPLNLNPLRDVLAAEVDFERLRAYRGVRVVVGATQVRTGRLREFAHEELSADVVMASACLPLLFHARTADFLDVTVQATITYRIVDAGLAAQRIDFSIDTASGRWQGSPLEQVAGLLTETAQQHALAIYSTAAPLVAAAVVQT